LNVTAAPVKIDDYCRQIEAYLCRRNHGHLIRIVGPSFDLVSGWAASGIPLGVAFSGIDRCVGRIERKPRPRPVKIDFCEADVLDAFDEWRRAVGLSATATAVPGSSDQGADSRERRGPSLPAHLARVVLRLSEARAGGRLDATFDDLIDQFSAELDLARGTAHGLRGEARQQLIERLTRLDVELVRRARAALGDVLQAELMSKAEEELSSFRSRMQPEAFAHARQGAFDRLVRERAGLPVVVFQP
jgi:hypothetical protein